MDREMIADNEYCNYRSPLSTRYATKEMKYNFSDQKKFSTWRKLWVNLAKGEKCISLSGWVLWYYDPAPKKGSYTYPVPVAFCAFTIVSLCMIIVYVFDEMPRELGKKFVSLFLGFNLTSCIIIFVHHGRNKGTMSDKDNLFWILVGVITLVNCVVCVVDQILIIYFFKKGK